WGPRKKSRNSCTSSRAIAHRTSREGCSPSTGGSPRRAPSPSSEPSGGRRRVLMDNFVGAEDLEAIALGAPILGTGGGGDPYIGKLIARQAISDGKQVPLIGLKEI